MRSHGQLVATVTAWCGLGLGLLVAAFSLPIDDFWLSLASARSLFAGADPARAIDLNWTSMLPGALDPQWGSQLLLGATSSLAWALAVNASLIAAGLALTALRIRNRASPVATAGAMLLVIGVLAPHLLARAQSFSVALLPALLLLLDRRPAPRWLPVALALVMSIWANLHGAFVVGQVAVLAYLFGDLLAWRRGDPGARPLIMAFGFVATVMAPLANPAGARLLAYAYTQPGLDVVRQISVEWQPSWPWIPVASLAWLFLGLLVIGRIKRRGAISPRDALFGAAVAALAISGIRHIPWLVLAMAPLLAQDLDALLRASPKLAALIGVVRKPLGGASGSAILLSACLLAVALQPVRTALPERLARLTPDAPVVIADALEVRLAAGQGARILNEQVWGGYLAWRLGDRIEIAMDGRLEIRSRDTWISYFALMHGDNDPAGALDAEEVTWAALRPDREPLMRRLLSAGWEVVLIAPEGSLLHKF